MLANKHWIRLLKLSCSLLLPCSHRCVLLKEHYVVFGEEMFIRLIFNYNIFCVNKQTQTTFGREGLVGSTRPMKEDSSIYLSFI